MQFLRKQRGRGRVQAMLSIWLLISVSLFVLALAGSYWVTSVVSGYAAQTYQANINSVVRMFDREMEHLQAIAVQLSSTAWVRRIMFMQGGTIDKSRVSDYSLYEYQQQMKTFRQTNSLISEIGVVFFQKDLVIAAYGKSNFSFLAGNALAVDGFGREDWKSLARQLVLGRLFQKEDVSIKKYGVANRGTLLIYPLQDGTTTKITAAMFVVLQHQNLYQFLRPQLIATGAQEAMLKIYGQEASEPFLSKGTPVTGEKRSIQSVSAKTGWTFAIEIPESIVLTGATSVRNILLAVAAGMWLISMLFSLLIARRFFTPIERIMRMFGAAEDSGSRFINEYDAIQKGIAQLHEQRAHLKAELMQRQPMARAAGLQALLTRDTITPQEMDKALGVLDITKEWPYYCVCLMMPMYGKSGEEPDMQALEQLLAVKDPQSAAAAGRLSDVPTALICVADKQALENRIALMLERFPHCCAILGEMVDNKTLIARAYKTAQAARDYRLVSEGFRILRYDAALLSKGGYYLPQDMEYKLLQAVRNGNGLQAEEVFDKLYRHNAAQHQATYASLRNFLFNIRLDVMKLLCEGNLSENPFVEWQDDEPLEKLLTQVRTYLGKAGAVYKARIQATPTRLEDILAYVQANLYDSSLSLTMVADAFGVSNSLISRLFSEQRGENFLNLVNRLRIEYACAFLARDLQTDILAVAHAAGYDNDVTFRRLFKKYTGLTPSQYRENAHGRDHTV